MKSATPHLDGDESAADPGGAKVSATAYGPADVRDTPHVKPTFPNEPKTDKHADDPWIGRTLSNVYEISEKIGEGGMGSVYLARHIHLQKTFAIKVLIESIAGKDNAVERLKQEAISAAGIDHENIVDVVNFDRTEDGAVFIVMEHLRGENLADAVGRGPIELHRALPIAYQICRALQAAHEHGIVHRDLKPENVFLTEKSGRTIVKVLDFGISKIKKAEAEQVRMTKTGQLVGTPLYMSPEQARGESDIDHRVDVYALGVMLFEMITGTPPFEGRNYFELLWKHGNEAPPLMAELNPNVYVPGAVDLAVGRALEKDRALRYQSMAELEQALMDAAPDVPSLPGLASLPPEGSSSPLLAASARPSGFGNARTEMMGDEEPEAGRAPRSSARSANRSAERSAERSVERSAERSGERSAARAPTSDDAPLPSRPLGPILAVAAGLVLVSAAVIYAMTSGEPAPPTTATATAARVVPTVPVEVGDPRERGDARGPVSAEGSETPRGVDPPAPALVSLALGSSPSGAEVRAGDRVLGTTPFTASLPSSMEPIELTFAMRGYLPQSVSVVPVLGAEIPEVRLRRRPRASSDSNGSGSPLPIKTGL